MKNHTVTPRGAPSDKQAENEKVQQKKKIVPGGGFLILANALRADFSTQARYQVCRVSVMSDRGRTGLDPKPCCNSDYSWHFFFCFFQACLCERSIFGECTMYSNTLSQNKFHIINRDQAKMKRKGIICFFSFLLWIKQCMQDKMEIIFQWESHRKSLLVWIFIPWENIKGLQCLIWMDTRTWKTYPKGVHHNAMFVEI